jgi:hypothetical protein
MSANLAESQGLAPGGATPANFTPELQMASMLGLCEAQMESAMEESDRAVDALIQAFTCLVDTSRSVNALTAQLPQDYQNTVVAGLNQQVATISKQMASAVVAFQFYDKLSQRLGHVRYSLSTLAMFVCDRTQSENPDQWRRLMTTLRRLYRTEEERQLFQSLMDGAADDEATVNVAALKEETAVEAAVGEIELF